MTKLVNRAKMTTATTGTGTITLGSAVDGYQTFADAGVANGDVVRYVIEDGDAWEIGLGTYTATGTTLTRGSIESSNSDLPLNLTGNAVVYVSAAAADLQELVDFADNFVLPTADGSTGQVLTTNGAGTLTFTTVTGYTDADVDTHLNTGTASSGEVLSWTGSDYDWVAVSGGATDINGLTDGYCDQPTTGTSGSVGLGAGALANDDGFNRNVAVGVDAANSVTSALYTVALGWRSGQKITTGSRNVAIGYATLSPPTSTTGSKNMAVGDIAGNGVTTGSNNVFMGSNAGSSITTGFNNVFVGDSAGASSVFSTTGSNQIVIGQGADASSATVSNEITLGNTSITRFRIPGAGIDNTSAALSGTTPSVDVGARDTYTLTTSGNTTFTFTGAPSSGQVGTFSLIITAGGTHTLTWPASVDWAGGTAPDAPASGEKDVYTFMTVDGGTTWYGFLAGDAMA